MEGVFLPDDFDLHQYIKLSLGYFSLYIQILKDYISTHPIPRARVNSLLVDTVHLKDT